MSPADQVTINAGWGFPRVSGDEPDRTDPSACADGFSPRVMGVRRRAHPRSRGENWVHLTSGSAPRGSSPLTRGKLSVAMGGATLQRLIPAHAGKTISVATALVSQRAHPRSRGENFITTMYGLGLRGSSPLTRGKPVVEFAADRPRGLIPAHAGKTRRPWLVRP